MLVLQSAQGLASASLPTVPGTTYVGSAHNALVGPEAGQFRTQEDSELRSVDRLLSFQATARVDSWFLT